MNVNNTTQQQGSEEDVGPTQCFLFLFKLFALNKFFPQKISTKIRSARAGIQKSEEYCSSHVTHTRFSSKKVILTNELHTFRRLKKQFSLTIPRISMQTAYHFHSLFRIDCRKEKPIPAEITLVCALECGSSAFFSVPSFNFLPSLSEPDEFTSPQNPFYDTDEYHTPTAR